MNEGLSIDVILSRRIAFPPGEQVAVTAKIEEASRLFF